MNKSVFHTTMFKGLDTVCMFDREDLMKWIGNMKQGDIDVIRAAKNKLDVALFAHEIANDETGVDVKGFEARGDLDGWENKHYVQLAEIILDDQMESWWDDYHNEVIISDMIQGINDNEGFERAR